MSFGSWLKAEANESSPFYGKTTEELMEEDVIPKTPVSSGKIVVYESNPAVKANQTSSRFIKKGKDVLIEDKNWDKDVVSIPYTNYGILKAYKQSNTSKEDKLNKGTGLIAQTSKKTEKIFVL